MNNQIDKRGTGNAIFDYAHYNEEILGNQSLIFAHTFAGADKDMLEKLDVRFGKVYSTENIGNLNLDVLYHIKYGTDDHPVLRHYCYQNNIRYAVHAVFDVSQPHGNRFAAVSNWLRNRAPVAVPAVPHIVKKWEPAEKMSYGYSADMIFIGRHGGRDSFDITWAWDAIKEVMFKRAGELKFMFMNTDNVPDFPGIVSLPGTTDQNEKNRFIGRCDAMLHARHRGETFGLSVADFAVDRRPVITYELSPERAHLEYLGKQAVTYYDANTLFDILMKFEKRYTGPTEYEKFTPEYVMERFKEVFLDEGTWDRYPFAPR